MCFYIHRDHRKEKIAEQDIVCYKRLKPIFLFWGVSPFRGFSYRLRKTYKSKIIRSRYSSDRIEEGLHSYSDFDQAYYRTHYDESIYKAIIPKGSTYYYNPEDHEYVSNRLKVIKKIKIK